MEFCVYILHSEILSKFYTGYTSNLGVRTLFHDNPESWKYTYRAGDWKVFLKIPCHSQKQAMAIEKHIKNMKSSIYIKNLAKYPEIVEKLLTKYY